MPYVDKLTLRLQSVQNFAKEYAEDDHREIGQGAKGCIAGHVELEHLLHVERNLDEEHIPAEVVAGVSNENCPEGHRSEHLAPWYLWMMFDLRFGAQRAGDHVPFLGTDEALLVGIILHQDYPQDHPDAAQSAHHIEHRLPAPVG